MLYCHSGVPGRPAAAILARRRHSRRPTVIPAKAGIHTPGFTGGWRMPGFWIPACAGMTDAVAIIGRDDGCFPAFLTGGVGGESPQPPFCERGAFGFASAIPSAIIPAARPPIRN